MPRKEDSIPATLRAVSVLEALVAAERKESREAAARRGALGSAVLEKRDRYIAAQIARTLDPGETGLIFLGMLHSLVGRLPRDIEILR